jgi:hypothetical protein
MLGKPIEVISAYQVEAEKTFCHLKAALTNLESVTAFVSVTPKCQQVILKIRDEAGWR